MNIGIITGSGFYDFPELTDSRGEGVSTPFGDVTVKISERSGHTLIFIARHGAEHTRLPNMINHRAHIWALKEYGTDLVVATSIMGVIGADLPLARLFLFDDLFFIDNRLPGGEICSIYTEPGDSKRGHYLFSSPFSGRALQKAGEVAEQNAIDYVPGLVHAHANGPRFNSKAEIAMFRQYGCSTVSQTVGPEIVLSGELETAYLLLGFGVDYANGVKNEPTPVEVLDENMSKSRQVFSIMILGLVDNITDADKPFFDNGFVYRFEY